jgi:two-component system chemotaxis sensor kinase CheA
MDLSKYRALFISEAREHIEGMGKALLTIERRPTDRAALDELFRHAHSVKGMAASMGYEAVATVSHRLEDIADLARQGAPFDAAAIELWLSGVDWLASSVQTVEAGLDAALVIPELLGHILEKSARMKAQVAAVAAAPRPLLEDAPPPTGVLPMGTEEWEITAVISQRAVSPHVRAFLVHQRISEGLEVTQCVPALAQLRQGVLPNRTLTLRLRGGTDEGALRQLMDRIPDVERYVIASVRSGAEGADGETRRPMAREAGSGRTVRLRTELLDELIDSVGEILLARARLRSVATRLEDPPLAELADEFARLAQGLHDRVLSARMTPVSVLSDRLPRVVRDLARKRGRDTEFSVEGANIELDRAILDELHDPVLHLVRNAVDHAHEGGVERKAAGKPATMRLTLSAWRDRDHVLLALSDDGRGMDPEVLRRRALERSHISAEEARTMSAQAILELICRPGFSTASEVNDTSGRGVGMDVVNARVEQLGGQLVIESVPGKGSTFTLRLPLTLAIIRVLLVHAAGGETVYALPLHRVDQALAFSEARRVASQGGWLYPVGSGLTPVYDLGTLLGYDTPAGGLGGTVVVMERPSRPLAVRVESIVGQQEVVVKPLGEPLGNVSFLAGAALLADGRPTYILDLAKLVDGAGASESRW